MLLQALDGFGSLGCIEGVGLTMVETTLRHATAVLKVRSYITRFCFLSSKCEVEEAAR